QPELLAKVRGTSSTNQRVASLDPASSVGSTSKTSSNKIASTKRDNLGAGSVAKEKAKARATASSPAAPSARPNFTVLNGSKSSAAAKKPEKTRIATLSPNAFKNAIKQDSKSSDGASGPKSNSAKSSKQPSTTASKGACRVWQASYGGSRALIIKAIKEGVTNYTVLDVNAGREQREAAAYISAYAKGGKTLEEFRSPKAALAKAFELCPEK
ncbi:MAG: hypothetical protein AAFO75_08835, partial [Pseudomonadota bacterium]